MNSERSDDPSAGGAPLFAGRIHLRQTKKGHRVGTDAVLLAASAPVVSRGAIIDAGAGVGAVGLAAALASPAASLVLADADPEVCALAIENLRLNGFAERGRVVEVDLLSARARRAAGLADASAELVLLNPPFYDAGTVRPSPDPAKARAHVLESEPHGGLQAWIRMATALTAPGGFVALIHRSDRIAEILAACEGRLGEVKIAPIYPRDGAPAVRIVLRGRRGSRAPTSLLPGLTLHRADGGFTPLADAIHRGEARLPMA